MFQQLYEIQYLQGNKWTIKIDFRIHTKVGGLKILDSIITGSEEVSARHQSTIPTYTISRRNEISVYLWLNCDIWIYYSPTARMVFRHRFIPINYQILLKKT